MTITQTIGCTLAGLLLPLSTFVAPASQAWSANPIQGGPVLAGEKEKRSDAGIHVEFKLDPRITRALYMGDRWVSAPFTQRGDQKQVIVEARAEVVDANGKRLDKAVEWIPADPTIATVASGRGNQVVITVVRTGQTSLRLVADGMSTELTLAAVDNKGALEAQLSQKK